MKSYFCVDDSGCVWLWSSGCWRLDLSCCFSEKLTIVTVGFLAHGIFVNFHYFHRFTFITWSPGAGVRFATPPLISSRLAKNVTFVTLHTGGVFTPSRLWPNWHFWRPNFAHSCRGFVIFHHFLSLFRGVEANFWVKLDPRIWPDLIFFFSLIWAFRGYMTPPFGPLLPKVIQKFRFFGTGFLDSSD